MLKGQSSPPQYMSGIEKLYPKDAVILEVFKAAKSASEALVSHLNIPCRGVRTPL